MFHVKHFILLLLYIIELLPILYYFFETYKNLFIKPMVPLKEFPLFSDTSY